MVEQSQRDEQDRRFFENSYPNKEKVWARWRRKYPNVEAWTEAHPGEAVGIVREMPSVVYYYTTSVSSRFKSYYFSVIGVPSDGDLNQGHSRSPGTEVSRKEFLRERLGRNLPRKRTKQPTWPPSPEQWGIRKPKSRIAIIKQIKGLMKKHNVTLEELK